MNGTPTIDRTPLAGWAVVQSNGLTLIGLVQLHERADEKMMALSPVFEMRATLTDKGPAHPIFPVYLLGIEGLFVPPGSIVIPCEQFTMKHREHLYRNVTKALEVQASMRAAEKTGLVLVKGDVKLPDPPRRPG